jgi:tRNA dimethylallyltransferase
LLDDITGRGALPLLVGGTMLYFKALWEGLDDLPPADAALRAQFEAQALAAGWPAMHQKLRLLDPVTAQRLSPNDSQRIGRALEVHTLTGMPISALHQRKSRLVDATLSGAACGREYSGFALFSLEPTDRAVLHGRIAARLDAMLQGGLLDEVRRLRALPQVHAELPALRAVGYRQAWQALDGAFPMAELRDRAIAATRQLAKRQITWLRGMPWRTVVACDRPIAARELRQRVLALPAFATMGPASTGGGW